MDQVQAEIEAIRSQIEELRNERDALTKPEIVPEDSSPEAITEAYRRQARMAAEVSTEVEGIDNAIAALENQIKQKQRQIRLLPNQQRRLSQEQQIEDGVQRAYEHAERINELAKELSDELRALKALAYDLSPSYWQLHYKPFITGFKNISVPFLRSDNDVLMISKFKI